MDTHPPNLPEALDLTHHLSELSKERRYSPLKSFAKYMFDPTIASLAGGLPNAGIFPFETISSLTLSPSTFAPAGVSPPKPKGWLESLFKSGLTFIETKKYAAKTGDLELKSALQYGSATGLPKLNVFLREWTKMLTPPAYKNWDVLLNDGSTDGFHKIVEMLCERGDGIIVESFTYPSALETGWPMGVRPVPVAIDGQGLIPEALEEMLENWDEKARGGMRRPRVYYTVPIGQNPTGSTLPEDRRGAIYKLACKYDIIVVEDDPYHSLNFGPYGTEAPGSKEELDPSYSEKQRNARFLKDVGLSYLRHDVEGRVIRIDTFSKTIAPGCRLGWTTANTLFTERLLRASETSTQQPSGPVQVLVTNLIVETWHMEGWIRWLRGLRGEYGRRRDWMVDTLVKGFDIKDIPSSAARITAYASPSASLAPEDAQWNEKLESYQIESHRGTKKAILSFVPPTAGMFVWVTIHLSGHPALKDVSPDSPDYEDKKNKIMTDLWTEIAEAKVLVAPGWMFAGDGLRSGAPKDDSPNAISSSATTPVYDRDFFQGLEGEDERSLGHFRLAFATLEEKPMKEAVAKFCVVVKKFFA